MIKVSVYYEDNLVREFEQSDSKDITIGRAAGCAIQLDEGSISRLHALIRFSSGSWSIERRANFGAVTLNGQEIENAPLEGGEEITIGKFSLRINVESSQASASRAVVSAGGSDDSIYREESGGQTRVVDVGLKAVFRFEPGAANLSEFVMEKDLAVFGRGTNCDVVLTEKKASRKHFEVRKQGLSFIFKDLNSANGTLINGNAASEAELVPGDLIEIGETKIQFLVENQNYFSQQNNFLAVPSHLEQADLSPFSAEGMGEGASEQGGIPGIDTIEPPLSSTDVVGRAKRAWFKIPKQQRLRYLTILVVFALITALLGGPDEAPKKRPVRTAGGKLVRTYEQLNAEKRKFVRENYDHLIKSQEKKDYTKMLDHTRNILTYVDDYKDTKTYESMARKRLEEIEEEKRRAAAEKRRQALEAEVRSLEEKGKQVYLRALEDPTARPELESVIQEIYAKSPNNRIAQEWKEGIRLRDLRDREEAEAARRKEEERQRAEDEFSDVMRIFNREEYVEALKRAEKLHDNGWTEDGYPDRIEKLKNEIKLKLSSIIDPKLREAKAQLEEGGDLVKANDLYTEVLRVDPSNREAIDGKSGIRSTLHLRAKRFYAEAILAESVSDLNEARDKFEKCLRWAPEDDIYKRRCRSKLSRFDYLSTTPGTGGL